MPPLACVLLLPPTLLMGGTLPILTRVFLNSGDTNTARSVSLLYFANTLGAVIGTLAAGLVLLQWLGIRGVLVTAGVVNLFIFAVAWRLPAPENQGAGSAAEPANQGAPTAPPWSTQAVLAVAVLFVSGMTALIYEVAWTRVLTLVIGSSTYAFTLMLATFLIGIALGSALVRRYALHRQPGLGLLAVCQLLIGLCALATAALFGLLPDAFVSLFGRAGQVYGVFQFANFLLCIAVMVPATLFMGASFPVASALVVQGLGHSGRRIGLLYAGNTVGAILGAFLAGFVLLPQLGIQRTLVLTIAVNLASALALSAFLFQRGTARGRWAVPALASATLLVLAFVWQPPWDRLKMTSGPYAYAVQYQKVPIDQRLARVAQLYYREGPMATVSVIQEGEHVRVVVDGKTDAGNARDMTTQVFAGHPPLLAKPDAKDVLIIGYASGITAGAVGRHAVSRIDCVEIEPAMREASRWFREENYHIADDPRFNLVIDDARSYMLAARRQYDVIISEPSNPWQAGSSRLFTQEAFENARRNLKPGGVVAQWMHLYGVDVESFRLVVRSFMSVFPHVTLWADLQFPDVILLGSEKPLVLDPLALQSMLGEGSAVAASLARIGYADAGSLFKAFLLGEDEARQFAGSGVLNTDNLPLLEFRAPRSLYSSTALQDNVKALMASKGPESFPAVTASAGQAQEAAALLQDWADSLARNRAPANALGALARAVELLPDDGQAWLRLALGRGQVGRTADAAAAFDAALQRAPSLAAAHVHLGALYLQAGAWDKAYAHLRQALAAGTETTDVRNNMAVVMARSGRMAEAVTETRRALELDPANQVARSNLQIFLKRMERP
ncbi:MAG: fused MFS/spermidine synthase [Rubrivivax sp.]|nr:fused MFS/spermidine synthase [Rubrivivax sp.]